MEALSQRTFNKSQYAWEHIQNLITSVKRQDTKDLEEQVETKTKQLVDQEVESFGWQLQTLLKSLILPSAHKDNGEWSKTLIKLVQVVELEVQSKSQLSILGEMVRFQLKEEQVHLKEEVVDQVED